MSQSDDSIEALIEELEGLNDRLSKLLDGVCLALKGKPPPGVLYSWHDLPELADRHRKALQQVMQCLGPDGVPGNVDYGDKWNLLGLSAEVDEALRAVRGVGIEYKRRK